MACGLALLLFARTLASVDLAGAAHLLRATGPALLLAFVPFSVAMAIDTAGWARLLRAMERRVSFFQLLGIRIATEAVHNSLPGGAVVADGLNPYLLHRWGGVPLGEAAVSVGARKWLIMRGHGAYIVIGAVAGFAVLERCSIALVGGRYLPWIVLATALVPLAFSRGLEAAFRGRAALGRAHSLLARVPWPRLQTWLASRRDDFHATDRCIDRLSGAGRSHVRAASLFYLATWLMESLESFMLVRLVGAPLGFTEILAIEGGLSLLRSAAFFAPAGIGVQDLGYVLFFRALGVSDAGAVAAAFVLSKRAKELAWIAVGYLLLFGLRSPVLSRAWARPS